jgi:hypothetical protein
MSEILIGSNPNKPEVVGSYSFTATNDDKAKQLPEPSGYRILCAIPEAEKEFDSGIAKSDETIRHDEILTTVLFVVKLWFSLIFLEISIPAGASWFSISPIERSIHL